MRNQNSLDPRLKDLIECLGHHGFIVTHNGGGWDGEVLFVTLLAEKKTLFSEADRLVSMLKALGAPARSDDAGPFWQVEATYDPIRKCCLIALLDLESSDVPGVNNWRN